MVPLTSCSSKIQEEDLYGIWIQPVPGSQLVQGVELKSDGSARSVNMATLLYDSWKLDSKSIILNGLSIGNGASGEFSDTLSIVKLTPDEDWISRLVLRLKCGKELRQGRALRNSSVFSRGQAICRKESSVPIRTAVCTPTRHLSSALSARRPYAGSSNSTPQNN